MEPLAKKSYTIGRDDLLHETLPQEKETEITKLAQHVVSKSGQMSYSQIYDIRERFYNRYQGKVFGGIRNFFYLLFHRSLREQLDTIFEAKTKSKIPLKELVELLPEFRKMGANAQQSILRFLDYFPVTGEKREQIENALRQGTLEPIYRLLRSNIALMKHFPECIEQGTRLHGIVNIAKEVEGTPEEQDWVDDFEEYRKTLSQGDENALVRESMEFIKGFCQKPLPGQFRACFRHLYTLIHLIKGEQYGEVYTYLSKARPFIQEELEREKREKSMERVGILSPEAPVVSPEIEERLHESASISSLLLRTITLAEAKARLHMHTITSSLGTEGRVPFFMPELGRPPVEGPTFSYERDQRGNLSVQAENPVKRGEFVSLSIREGSLVPLDEKSLLPRCIGAYYLVKNGSLQEALKLLPLAVSSRSPDASERMLIQSIRDLVPETGSRERGAQALSLRLASLEVYHEKPLGEGEEPASAALKETKELLIQRASTELARAYWHEVLHSCESVSGKIREVQKGISSRSDLQGDLERLQTKFAGNVHYERLISLVLDDLKNQGKPLEESLEHAEENIERIKARLKADFPPEQEPLKEDAETLLRYFRATPALSFKEEVETVRGRPLKAAVQQKSVQKKPYYDLTRITDETRRNAFQALVEPFGIPCVLSAEEGERKVLEKATGAFPSEREKQVEEEYRQLAEAAFERACRPEERQRELPPDYQSIMEQAEHVKTPGEIDSLLAQAHAIEKRLKDVADDKKQDLLLYAGYARAGRRPLELGEIMLLYALGRLKEEFAEEQTIAEKLFAYLQAEQDVQKARRIKNAAFDVKEATEENFQDKQHVLLEKICEEIAYPQRENPHFHVFEVLGEVFLRKQQFDSLVRLGSADQSVILQLLMGGGKTAILLPLLALMRANGANISTVMLREADLPEAAAKLRKILGRGFDQYIFQLSLPEGREMTLRELEEVESRLAMVQRKRGCLLLSPDKKHILLNMFTALQVELQKTPENEELKNKILVLARIVSTLENRESVIGDEIDALLKTTLQYIRPLGTPRHFDQVDAGLVSDLVLQAVEVAQHEHVRLDFAPASGGVQTTAFTPEGYYTAMKPQLVPQALDLLKRIGGDEGAIWSRILQEPTQKRHIERYISEREETAVNRSEVQESYEHVSHLPQPLKDRLAGIRFTLNTVLPASFLRNGRQEYGMIDTQTSFIARPFAGPDHPTETQFSNPYEQVAYTVQSLLLQGPPLEGLRHMSPRERAPFGILEAVQSVPALAPVVLAHPVVGLVGAGALIGAQALGGRPRGRLEALLLEGKITPERLKEEIQHDRQLLREFLAREVFPQVEVHERHIASDPHSLVDSSQSFSGMTGTLWNLTTMPGFESEHIYSDKATEAESLLTLYQKERAGKIQVVRSEKDRHSLLREMLYPPSNPPLALIDSGGWMRGLKVSDLAREILDKRSELEAVVFHNQEGKLVVLERGSPEPIPFSPESAKEQARKGRRFTIYAEEYTVGADIPQSERARALLTLDKKMILRDFQQAIFRMRKIQGEQECTILIDRDMFQHMQAVLAPESDLAHLSSVVRYLIKNEVSRRLDENYQATEQRVKNGIRSSLRRAITLALLKTPPDFAQASAIFREGELFFIESEKVAPFERYGKIPKRIPREEKIRREKEKYAACFTRLAHIEEVRQALGKTGESEQAIEEYLQNEVDKLYVESQFEREILDTDPSLELGRHVQVHAVQQTLQDSLERIQETIDRCEGRISHTLIHSSSQEIQEKIKRALQEKKERLRQLPGALERENPHVVTVQANRLYREVSQLLVNAEACLTLDQIEGRAGLFLQEGRSSQSEIAEAIETLLSRLVSVDVSLPLGEGVDMLRSEVEKGERALQAQPKRAIQEPMLEERQRILMQRMERALRTFHGVHLSAEHQAVVQRYGSEAHAEGFLLTDVYVRECEKRLREVRTLHETAEGLQTAAVCVGEGPLQLALNQWKEALSTATVALDFQRREELEKPVRQALSAFERKEVLQQLVRENMLERKEMEQVRGWILQRLYFIEKKERVLEIVHALHGQFPAQKEVTETLQRLSLPTLSLEDIEVLGQRAMVLKNIGEETARVKDEVERLLQLKRQDPSCTENSRVQAVIRKAEQVWREIYAKQSPSLSSQGLEEMRRTKVEIGVAIDQALQLDRVMQNGKAVFDITPFKIDAPPFGRLRVAMKQGIRLRAHLGGLLRKRGPKAQESSLMELAAHMQEDREQLEEAVRDLESEQATFSDGKDALLELDREELQALVDGIQHDQQELHLDEEAVREIASLLPSLGEALRSRAPLEVYSSRLNRNNVFSRAKACRQELIERRQRELQEQASVVYLKKELTLKRTRFQLEGIRGRYQRDLDAIQTMRVMGQKMAKVTEVHDEVMRQEHVLHMVSVSSERVRRKLEAFSRKAEATPQIRILLSQRIQALAQRGLELDRHLRQIQSSLDFKKLSVNVAAIQKQCEEYEQGMQELSSLTEKGERLYGFLERTGGASRLSLQEMQRACVLLKELALEKKWINMNELMEQEGWKENLERFFQSLAVSEDLFSEAVSFLASALQEPSRRDGVLKELIERRRVIESEEMKSRCENALREFAIPGEADMTQIGERFTGYMLKIETEAASLINRYTALLERSSLPSHEEALKSIESMAQVCHDLLGTYQLRAVATAASSLARHLEHVSLEELGSRVDFVSLYAQIASSLQSRQDIMPQTRECARQVTEELQRAETILKQKVHEEERRMWRQETVAKVAQVGKRVLMHTSLVGIGAFVSLIPGLSGLGHEYMSMGYQGAISSLTQPIIEGLTSRMHMPSTLQMLTSTLLQTGVSMWAAQYQGVVERGAVSMAQGTVNLASRAVNPITRYVAEVQFQRRMEEEAVRDRAQEPVRRARLKAEAKEQIERRRAEQEQARAREQEETRVRHEEALQRAQVRREMRSAASEARLLAGERSQESLQTAFRKMSPSERALYGREHALTTEEFSALQHVEQAEIQERLLAQQAEEQAALLRAQAAERQAAIERQQRALGTEQQGTGGGSSMVPSAPPQGAKGVTGPSTLTEPKGGGHSAVHEDVHKEPQSMQKEEGPRMPPPMSRLTDRPMGIGSSSDVLSLESQHAFNLMPSESILHYARDQSSKALHQIIHIVEGRNDETRDVLPHLRDMLQSRIAQEMSRPSAHLLPAVKARGVFEDILMNPANIPYL